MGDKTINGASGGRTGITCCQAKGMTFVEMTVAVALVTLVFGAMVALIRSARTSWQVMQMLADCVQNARFLMHHVQRNLAEASRVTAVSDSSETLGFIQFEAYDGSEYRYDVADGYVRYGTVGSPSMLAGPVSQLRFTCYDGNDFSNPTVDANAVRLVNIEATFVTDDAAVANRTFSTSVYVRPGTLDGFDTGEETVSGPCVALKQKVEWGGNGTVIDSYRFSQGVYDAGNPGNEAVLSVNATGTNKIVLWTNTIVRGDALIGPGGDVEAGIKLWSGSQVTGTRGTLDEVVDIPNLSAPTGPPFDGSHDGDFQLWSSMTATISSDRYFNKLQLWNNSKLSISGDVTILLNDKFEMASNAELEILPDSSLRLYVKKSVGAWNSARLNSSTKEPSRLRIYMLGSDKDFSMSSQAKAYAVVQNPNGDVEIWNNAEFFGKLKAKRLYGGGQIHVDLDATFD